MSVLLLLLALVGVLANSPPEGCSCETSYDCPHEECYTAECELQQCHYEREPIEECCLSSEECCEYATELQTAVCDKSCTCRFISTVNMECTKDEHCDQYKNADECRATSPCHQPVCDHSTGFGWCECEDLSHEDKDGDGVVCAEDCDDNNPNVAITVHCISDGDSDGFGNCNSDCLTYCVGANETCPPGYLSVFDNNSTTPSEDCVIFISECDAEVLEHIEEHSDELCDCCDLDCLAYPGSSFGLGKLNLCGEADYNCDGVPTKLSCCDEHDQVGCVGEPSKRNLLNYARFAWDINYCQVLDDDHVNDTQCGACETEDDDFDLFYGWACTEDCDAPAKRAPHQCPEACGDVCVCVDGDTSPQLGECAEAVTHCVEAQSDPIRFSDGTECCISIVN